MLGWQLVLAAAICLRRGPLPSTHCRPSARHSMVCLRRGLSCVERHTDQQTPRLRRGLSCVDMQNFYSCLECSPNRRAQSPRVYTCPGSCSAPVLKTPSICPGPCRRQRCISLRPGCPHSRRCVHTCLREKRFSPAPVLAVHLRPASHNSDRTCRRLRAWCHSWNRIPGRNGRAARRRSTGPPCDELWCPPPRRQFCRPRGRPCTRGRRSQPTAAAWR